MIREEKLVNESREKYERCDVIIKEVVEVEIGGGRLIERTVNMRDLYEARATLANFR